MSNENIEHAQWFEDLMDDVRSLRDDRGVVRRELLEHLSADERFALVECGTYTAPELWPDAHKPIGFDAAWEWLNGPGSTSLAERVSECCAGCWATLVAGVGEYEQFIERVAAGLVTAARSDRPLFPPPHVCHAVSRFLDTRPAEWTPADLIG